MNVMERTTPHFRPGVPGVIPDAWMVHPAGASTAPPVVVVHGINRDVENMARMLAPRAQAMGRTLVLPHFSKTLWPRYQRAACNRRADWALLALMTALRAQGQVADGRFDLSGFSGGAQFAHRFAWLYPDMVDRLCVTAPGWWTFPDAGASWPRGMSAARSDHRPEAFWLNANLRRFLNRRITVCVGAEDTTRDANLRQDADIDAQQGPNRVHRARRWCEMAQAQARAQGIDPAISLRVLAGCGHSFADCIAEGGLDRDFVAPAMPTASARRTADTTQVSDPQIVVRKAA